MSKTRERLEADRLLWWGVGLFVLGRIVDLIWHATHPEFETAADQLRAHSVVWLGALLMIVAAATAFVSGRGRSGYEHSQHRDPDLPHLLLLITNVAMFLGAG
jgi:hypothetical protein